MALVVGDNPSYSGVFEALDACLDRALVAGVNPVDCDDAAVLLREFEVADRRLQAAKTRLLGRIDAEGLHTVDGHASAKVMARHVGKLSNATACQRQRVARMLAHLTSVAAGFESGRVGVDQVNLLSRVYGNPRVKVLMVEVQDWFIEQATNLDYKDFEIVVRRWEQLADQDGLEPEADRCHQNRDAMIVQNSFDLSWDISANYGSLQGAIINEIFDKYCQAEFETDWEQAKTEHGDNTSVDVLERTNKQRRADALFQIFQDATESTKTVMPRGYVHNIVWSSATFEEMVSRLDNNYQPQPLEIDTYRCETIDGAQINPYEAIANAQLTAIRRVLVDAKSVTIDLGQQRLFSSGARTAVQISNQSCAWPGCQVSTRNCEIDHLKPYANGGQTNPNNGVVLCGRHNRWKQKNYTINRDPTGQLIITRPDHKQIE